MNVLVRKIFRPLSNQQKKYIEDQISSSSSSSSSPIPETLTNISKLVAREYSRQHCVPDKHRQSFVVTKIVQFLRRYAPPQWMAEQEQEKWIVDIGGGNGYVLQQLGTALGTTKRERLVCVETKTDWIETYHYTNEDHITYLFWNNTQMSIETASVDCVLCMVSLHHMTDETIVHTLKEVGRILKPGGLLLLKEHDATEYARPFIQWEHWLYHIADAAFENRVICPDEYLAKSIDNFKTQQEWRRLITEVAELAWIMTTNRFLDGVFVADKENKNMSNLYWDVYQQQHS